MDIKAFKGAIWFIRSLEICMKKIKGPNSKNEKVISLLNPFRETCGHFGL